MLRMGTEAATARVVAHSAVGKGFAVGSDLVDDCFAGAEQLGLVLFALAFLLVVLQQRIVNEGDVATLF